MYVTIVAPLSNIMLAAQIQSKSELHSLMEKNPVPVNQTHRHSQVVAEALAQLDLLHPLDGWTLDSKHGETQIYKRSLEGYLYPFVRGDRFFPNETVFRIISVLLNFGNRTEWDERTDSIEQLEFLDSKSQLLYTVQKGQFPVSPRDVGLLISVVERDGKVDIVGSSVEDKVIPGTPWGRVRAETHASWRLEMKEGGVQVSYICYVDPKGSVPSALFKMVQSQLAECVSNVHRYLETKGPCVTVLIAKECESTVQLDGKNYKGSHDRLDFKVKTAGDLFLGIPPKLASKVTITAPQGTSLSVVDGHGLGDMQVLKLVLPTDGQVTVAPGLFTLNGTAL
jgi:hypothetical protein